MTAEMKQKHLNRVWKNKKQPFAARVDTSRINAIPRSGKRRSNDGGPQSSGANLEPVAPRKRKRDAIDLNNSATDPIVIDKADGNGDILMIETVSKRIKLEMD